MAASPIEWVELPGATVSMRGLVVVLGPNSSGKSQLLHDLLAAATGRERSLVVAQGVKLRPPPDFEEYLRQLVDAKLVEDRGGSVMIRSLQLGAEEGGGHVVNRTPLAKDHINWQAAANAPIRGRVSRQLTMAQLGNLDTSVLFLKNRLELMDECEGLDFREKGPTKTLQALYVNRAAKKALQQEIGQVFRRWLWIDATVPGRLMMRATDGPLPSAEERHELSLMEQYRKIETEGDGLRSYAAVCATLALGDRGLVLIDEPEMCLHPPQAHAMGRLLGKHKIEGQQSVVVSTHSSHLLRGILETNASPTIVRLTRNTTGFRAQTIEPQVLQQLASKPRSRSEAILDGLLSDAIVLCEADGDRVVYEATHRTLPQLQLDVRFIPVDGTGGFAEPLRLYSSLNVPAAVIADIDFLAKDRELRAVLSALDVPPAEVSTICNRSQSVMTTLRSKLQASDADADGVLDDIVQTAPSLKGNVAAIRGKLSGALESLKRNVVLKALGVAAVPQHEANGAPSTLRADLENLIRDLRSHGVFVVPIGELESWLAVPMKGVSKTDKSTWAMLAAERIEHAGEQPGDVWEFLKEVRAFLGRSSGTGTTPP